MTANKSQKSWPRTDSLAGDHDDYRALLDASQRGLESAKAFILAVRSSKAATANNALRVNASATEALLDEVTVRLDQVWDEFQRI